MSHNGWPVLKPMTSKLPRVFVFVFALAVVSGCGDSKTPPSTSPPTTVVRRDAPQPRQTPQPAHTEPDAPSSDDPATATPPEPVNTRVDAPPRPDAVRRSPYPAEGESIQQPIRLPQLAEIERPDIPESGIVPWAEAHHYVGMRITVEGEIVDTFNHKGNVCFLNFHEDWQGKFYVPVFKEVFPDIPDKKPQAYYLNKTLRITGTVTKHQGRPNIEVHSIKQIEIVE